MYKLILISDPEKCERQMNIPVGLFISQHIGLGTVEFRGEIKLYIHQNILIFLLKASMNCPLHKIHMDEGILMILLFFQDSFVGNFEGTKNAMEKNEFIITQLTLCTIIVILFWMSGIL